MAIYGIGTKDKVVGVYSEHWWGVYTQDTRSSVWWVWDVGNENGKRNKII